MARRTFDSSEGRVNREFAAVWKAIRESKAAKTLQAATIGRGGIKMLAGSAITALYPSGRKVLQLGSFTGANANLEEVPGIGIRLMLDDDYASFGLPNIQKPLLDLFRDDNTGEVNAQIAGVTHFNVFSSDEAKLYGSSTNASMGIEDTGDVILSPAVGKDVKAFVGTSAGSANAVIDAGTGAITRSTSSRRYKQDIADADVDVEKVLALTPRRFRLKHEVEKHGEDAPTYVGFIAEEAADLGLDDWVTEDEDGPEAFSYATYVVALQAAVRELSERVKALESVAESKPPAG